MSTRLPALFSDHMLLQRDQPIPVWGWDAPGAAIVITLADHTATAVTDAEGRWSTTLPPMPAGGPHTLTVAGSTTCTVNDVLVGEVWLASGQSNMEWPLNQTDHADGDIPAADFPAIRLFTVQKAAVVDTPCDVQGVWTPCTPDTVEDFSAVAYYFGRQLHEQLGIPIGLINASWGGTMAEAWTSREALDGNEQFRPLVKSYEAALPHYDEAYAAYQATIKEGEANYYPTDAGNRGYAEGWADPATNTADWEEMEVPRAWQQAGLNFSGVVWFRKEIDIPAEWAGRPLVLHLAPCDKSDITYFNNAEIGGMGREIAEAWCTPREYPVPAELVRSGRNVIAVRIDSYVYAGGFLGARRHMRLALADDPATAIPLAGCWQYRVEQNYGILQPVTALQPLGPGNPQSPYSLYRGMIAPLAPYALRGVIWYQGESNAERAYAYRTLFPLMIADWRNAWGCDFPFYFVQLANYMQTLNLPSESTWAELREAQAMALALPNTGMAVIIDIGEAEDIHPRNKRDVGLRLARLALKRTYNRAEIVDSGPCYRAHAVEGNTIRVQFNGADGGLHTRDGGAIVGFALAGADRKFVWAQARIEGDTVIVWNEAVPRPIAVRYAWADNPVCNLTNGAGLPAAPFRTDDWPGLTAPKALAQAGTA
jgi:sialate O-acetylesterase